MEEVLKEIKKIIKSSALFCPRCQKALDVAWHRIEFYMKNKSGAEPENCRKLIQLLRKIKPKGFERPRNKHNGIWKKVQEKQARHCFKKGLYSLEEYNRKIKEINQKYGKNNLPQCGA